MPINLECDCGKALRVKDDLAGRKIRCPDCKGVVDVPTAEAEEEIPVVTPEPEQQEPDTYMTTAPKSRSSRPAYDDDDDDDEPRSRKKRYDDDDEDDDDDRPRRKKKRASDDFDFSEPAPRASSSYGAVNGGSIGVGVLMMVGAAVWFCLGLAADRIFFYPPVLFVLGFIAVIKGLMGRE